MQFITPISLALCALTSLSSHAFYPNKAKYAISLSFDDARKSQVDVGIPLLNKHDVKATFYLMPYHMQGKEQQWKLAAKAGHEIANHTSSHLCTGNFRWLRKQDKGLEQSNLSFLKEDIKHAQQYIKTHTGVDANGFAYPCGQTFVGRGTEVKSYVPLIAETFSYGRTWNDETANDPFYYDQAQIRAFSMDGKTFSELKALIEQAKFDNAWIVLAGHEVGEKGPYTVDRIALQQLIEYIKDPSNEFWLATVSDVNEYINRKTKGHDKK
ncbi:polysaccharide deacetylase family protein [Pseudoalteromonas phenolica]|uniref:polysaccharide deacetylase family protein n=1 Tax=Pseudoalteromonas phenolica TaxID=161398 RepID=UPI00110BA7C5|nr:polysaccharide deacetylase family protein [Pseudoalteromonas phenolica]TMO54727.1 polysaccharide deacetylase [Pseudoalteromonas phenolica]|tara:strand:+ start:702 stop:1505 length:804 start_codon:yes stop_codon:yes gene_type:complete